MTNDNKLAVVGDEGVEEVLLGARMAHRFAVPAEMMRAQPDAGAAFTLACSSSGLSDKEIYTELGLDQGYFSKIKSNQATLQADKIASFCQVVGNHVYLEWVAYQCGFGIVMIKSELERQLEAMRQELEQERLKVHVLMQTVQGKVAA